MSATMAGAFVPSLAIGNLGDLVSLLSCSALDSVSATGLDNTAIKIDPALKEGPSLILGIELSLKEGFEAHTLNFTLDTTISGLVAIPFLFERKRKCTPFIQRICDLCLVLACCGCRDASQL